MSGCIQKDPRLDTEASMVGSDQVWLLPGQVSPPTFAGLAATDTAAQPYLNIALLFACTKEVACQFSANDCSSAGSTNQQQR